MQAKALLTWCRNCRIGTILALSLCTLISGCSNQEKEAQSLYEKARTMYLEANNLVPAASNSDIRDDRLRSYEKIVALTNTINSRFPDTLIAQGVVSGHLDIGGVTLETLREQIIPTLRRELLAERDPLTAVRLLIERVRDAHTAIELLIELANRFDSAGRSSEAKTALGDAFARAIRSEETATRVRLLSAIAFGHANASRRNESLEVAFAALSAAKQVPDGDERALALTKIALSYYLLGSEEKGYEALQSISDKTRRANAINDVATELLEKNLAHQIISVSTLIFDLDQRARFLIEVASNAAERGLSPAVLLLVDQTLPLLSKIRDPSLRSIREVEAVRLLRLAGQPERAHTTLNALQARTPYNDQSIELYATIAVELAALNKHREAIELADRLYKRSSARPPLGRATIPVCMHIGEAYALADEPSKALQALDLIEDNDTKISALSAVAKTVATSGSVGFARRMLKEAEELLKPLTDSAARSKALITLRDAYLAINQLEDSKRLMLQLQNEDRRWRSYVRGFLQQLLTAGHINEALAVARAAPEPSMKALLLSEIAKARFAEQHFNEATTLLEEAAKYCDRLEDGVKRQALAAILTDTILQIKWPQLALEMLEKYTFDDAPVWYCRVAAAFAETGQKDESVTALQNALRATVRLPRPEDRARVLLHVGDTLSKLESGLDPESQLLLVEVLVPQ